VGQVFPEPLVLACGDETHPPDLIPEIRVAAALAASVQISDEIRILLQKLHDQSLAFDEFTKEITKRTHELERIAQGPNRQCREVATPSIFANVVLFNALTSGRALSGAFSSPLPEFYFAPSFAKSLLVVGSVDAEMKSTVQEFRDELLREMKKLIDSVERAQSFELGLSRASILPFSVTLLHVFDVPSPELFDATKWERVACGGAETFSSLGIQLDGSLFLQNNDSQGFPFREVGAQLWATSLLLMLEGLVQDASFYETLLDKALYGCTHELRVAAAELYLFAPVGLTRKNEAELKVLALEGGSAELRSAAASRLAFFYAFEQDWSDIYLQQLALTAETTELKSAAALALGLRWQVTAQKRELGLTTVFSFLGPDGRTLRQGNLIQFVAAHTAANPELAQAAILPLYQIFLLSPRR